MTDIAESFIPPANNYATLHEFYDSIKEGFTEDMFIKSATQYDPVDEDGDNIRVAGRRKINTKVTNVTEAKKLIDMIVEEGEGSSSTDMNAHVNKFIKIRDELKKELYIDKDFEPARRVFSNTMTRIHDDIDDGLKKVVRVIDPELDNGLPHNLLQLFNGSYEILLTWLYQVFSRQGSREELAAIETLAFMPFMTEIFRPAMELLTKYEITLGNEKGTLGAGFEMTSNNYMFPQSTVTHQLTNERLSDLRRLAESCLQRLKASSKDRELTEDLSFLVRSISILETEFKSRVRIGWKPKPDANSLSDNEYSEKPAGWAILGSTILELQFNGWCQCRLASDPDGMNEKRGVTGNNFAIGQEADLDQIIYFQPRKGKTFVRSHCPDIGITVTKATLLDSPYDNKIKDVPEFIEAKIDLLGSPRFEGRNHIVSEDGEPIDPFEIYIELTDKTTLQRAVTHSGKILEITPVQRRGTSRFPLSVAVSPTLSTEHLKTIQNGKFKTALEYVEDRIANLEKECHDYEQKKDEVSIGAVTARFRLNYMKTTLRAARGERVREGIRWTRFFFNAAYEHTLSGMPQNTVNDSSFPFSFPLYDDLNNVNSKWLIKYNIGFFDSDALSAHVFGSIRIPVILK